jgi:hypothetical protein
MPKQVMETLFNDIIEQFLNDLTGVFSVHPDALF